MWNTTEELARIRRNELLAEAREERLARIARAEARDESRRNVVDERAAVPQPATARPSR